MTSLAFIFGVVPLVWATGAGAELRQTLGTAVFSGMIGVTAFGLIFTPVFYVVSRAIASRRAAQAHDEPKERIKERVMAANPNLVLARRFGARRTTRCCAVAAQYVADYRAGRFPPRGRGSLAACACAVLVRRPCDTCGRCPACGWS